MEQMAPRIGIEPGNGLVGRFGDTVVMIRRGGPAPGGGDQAAGELLQLAAAVASDRQLPATVIAARLASWVIGHMAEDVTAFGIVAPVQDGVVMFLRGAVRGTITERGFTHQLSGDRPYLGRPAHTGNLRSAGDRIRGRSAGAGGSAVGPSRGGGAGAGFRLDPRRERARAGAGRPRKRKRTRPSKPPPWWTRARWWTRPRR